MGKKRNRRRGEESRRRMEQEFKDAKSDNAGGLVEAKSQRDTTPEVSPPFPPANRPPTGPSACLNINLTHSTACLVGRFRRKSQCLECGRA